MATQVVAAQVAQLRLVQLKRLAVLFGAILFSAQQDRRSLPESNPKELVKEPAMKNTSTSQNQSQTTPQNQSQPAPQAQPQTATQQYPAHISMQVPVEVSASSGSNSFVRRQERLTEVVKELSSPSQEDLFPLVVGVSGLDNDLIQLHIPSTPPSDVVDFLTCFIAPPVWDAIVVVACGRGFRGDAVDEHVILAEGLGRNHEEISLLRSDGEIHYSTLPASGRIIDCCRRAMGMDSMPADKGTVELFVSAWLSRIFRTVTEEEVTHTLDWPELVRLHPLMDSGQDHFSPTEVAVHACEISNSSNWENIRLSTQKGELPQLGISSEQAAWMDENMFARWCIDVFPDSDSLLEELQKYLSAELFCDLEHSIAAHRGGIFTENS